MTATPTPIDQRGRLSAIWNVLSSAVDADRERYRGVLAKAERVLRDAGDDAQADVLARAQRELERQA